jgi:hypothetical protein
MKTIELLYREDQIDDLRRQCEASGCNDFAEFIGKATALYTTLSKVERDGGTIQIRQYANGEWEPLKL